MEKIPPAKRKFLANQMTECAHAVYCPPIVTRLDLSPLINSRLHYS
jgi:hypothetical protein